MGTGIRACAFVALLWVSSHVAAKDTSPTLYLYPERTDRPLILRDGRFGPIASLQTKLRNLLISTDPVLANKLVSDGQFGPTSARALRAVLVQADYAEFAPEPGQPLRISVGLWQKLLGSQPSPGPEDRAMTLVLTYEATEFDKPASWNFCQNPLAGSDGKKVARRAPCRTNDDSILTWGPRGATMTGGSEIRAILNALEKRYPGLVAANFMGEYSTLQRVLRLSAIPPKELKHGQTVRGAENVSDLELFTCAIWINPARASFWSNALAKLGALATVQTTYNDLYASRSFDGAKMSAFYRLYNKLDVRPSEIDHAFFLDRSTHTSGVFLPGGSSGPNTDVTLTAVAAHVRAMLGNGPWENWQVRRALSRFMVPGKQVDDRNGRDVAFFVDGVGEAGLTQSERTNWHKRMALAASFAGLSDKQIMSIPSVVSNGNWNARQVPFDSLTAAERADLCPVWVIERTRL